MKPLFLDEAQVEIGTVDYFCELGYEYLDRPQIAPDLPAAPGAAQADGETAERVDYGRVVLLRRLRDALVRINPECPTKPSPPNLIRTGPRCA